MRPIGLAIIVAAFALSIGASAGAGGGKQRVAIQWKGASGFVLIPLTAGKLKGDTGTVTFCCWTSREVIRDGAKVGIGNPKMTLVGQHGTLVASNRMEFLDIRGGYSVFTGTWKVIRGTGTMPSCREADASPGSGSRTARRSGSARVSSA